MNTNTIFFNEFGRLRSGWRFAAFAAVFIAVSIVLTTVAYTLAVGTSSDVRPTTVFLLLNGILSLIAALAIGYLCAKVLERLPFSSLGASFERHWLRNLAIGLAVGISTFALAAAIGIVSGGLKFSLSSAPPSEILWTLGLTFLVFAAAAAFEEALFRGYILQTFVRSDLALFGVVLTSLLFATVHNGNPAASPLSWLNTFIAGVWFAVAYLKARDLWLPFGLHLAWNWAQGSIFGVEVSGLTDLVKAPLMREIDTGPAWLTGGNYGIEGGVITTAAIVLSTIALYFLPGQIVSGDAARSNDSIGPA